MRQCCLLSTVSVIAVSVATVATSFVIPQPSDNKLSSRVSLVRSRNNHHHHSRLNHKVSLPNIFDTGESPTDAVLKEFDKKEAVMQKRREDAKAKLDEYDATLTKIQSRKAEYMAASQLAEPPIGGSFSETTLRSAVKAFVWRLIAGCVTFITTLQFSGSIRQALQVVGADFFSKSFTMFIGERLMNKSQAGRKKGGDNAQRSLIKALIWRLFAICNTLTMAVFISKDLSIASKIASTDAVFKTALMFFYERVWARIGWVGSAVAGVSFLAVHQQLSFRERLTYRWNLQEMAEQKIAEVWKEFRDSRGGAADKNLITNVPSALTKVWNKGVGYMQDALKRDDDR